MPLLYRAIMSRRPDNVLMLLEFGADINHRDYVGKTPLIDATTARMFETALLLLRQGADPTIKNQWGNGPADIVMQFGNRGIDRRTNDLVAFDEFVDELKARGLLQEDPPRFEEERTSTKWENLNPGCPRFGIPFFSNGVSVRFDGNCRL